VQKHRVRRFHRAEFAREVQVFLDNETSAYGLTRDLSTDSVSIFLSLKGAHNFLKDITVEGQIKLSALKKKLINQILLISITDSNSIEPLDLTVLRVEISWQKGFDIFVAGRFLHLDDFKAKELEKACPSVSVRQETDEHYISSKLPLFRQKIDVDSSEHIHLEYTSNYANVRSTRDYIANLAERHEFNEEEVYQIKLMVDEILMNAFLYGSTENGRNHTNVKILLGTPGLYIEVTDHAGHHFNDRPYHIRRDVRSGPVGGLALVEAYSDDWQVDIHRGKFTRITFYKTRSQNI
jgi:anti-sigma regulatory factor (Ser/Thr protein kinase)